MQAAEERPWHRHWPADVPKSIDYPNMDVPELLRHTARRYPERIALSFYGKSVSYRELDTAADRFASGLCKIGVRPGDRVSLLLPNTPHFFIALFGVLRMGGIVAQTSPLYTARELENLYNDAGVESVVAMDLFWPNLAKAKPATRVRRIVVCDMKEFLRTPLRELYPLRRRRELRKAGHWPLDIPKEPWIHRFSKVTSTLPDLANEVSSDPDDVAVLQYTGGTTGTPKGAMLTHRNLVACGSLLAAWLSHGARPERILGAAPAFHGLGLMGTLFTVAGGHELILEPNPRDIGHILHLIQKNHATFLAGVPTMFIALLRHPRSEKHDLHSLQTCISGGGPLPSEVRREFERRTGGHVVEAYGLTESSGIVSSHPHAEDPVAKGGVGIPLPDTDVRIVDLDSGTTDVRVGETGELIARGPQVMKGYWNQPEETALVLRDGWLFTGDIARMDEDGYLYIVERKKDMIIASGYKVYPRDVEEILYTHPAVAEAAVIGVPDAYRGETVKAFVVLKPGASASQQEIVAFCKKSLATYKVPKMVEFVGDLPKSLVGKVLRRELREKERAKAKPAS